jgi:hypothetical protein
VDALWRNAMSLRHYINHPRPAFLRTGARRERPVSAPFQRRFSARPHYHRKKLRPGTYQLTATHTSSNGYNPVTTAKKKFVVTR